MFCPSCGSEITGNAAFCMKCGAKIECLAAPICAVCGTELPAGAGFCPACGAKNPGVSQSPVLSDKSRLVFILLAVFLGGLGVHNFYAGRFKYGIAQIVVTCLSFGIGAVPVYIWACCEAALVEKDAKGRKMAMWVS